MALMLASDKINLMYWMDRGGWVMWPIAACGLFGLVVTLERLWVFHRAGGGAGSLAKAIRSDILEGKNDRAFATCGAETSSVSRVFRAILGGRSEGLRALALEKAAETSAVSEVTRLEKRLWLLALFTGLAPILGFLGTVVGMIASFEVISTQGMNNPGLVAEGISVALITTAGGLIVAVFVLPFYNYFTQRVGEIQHDMEMGASFLLQSIEEAGARGSKT